MVILYQTYCKQTKRLKVQILTFSKSMWKIPLKCFSGAYRVKSKKSSPDPILSFFYSFPIFSLHPWYIDLFKQFIFFTYEGSISESAIIIKISKYKSKKWSPDLDPCFTRNSLEKVGYLPLVFNRKVTYNKNSDKTNRQHIHNKLHNYNPLFILFISWKLIPTPSPETRNVNKKNREIPYFPPS